MNTSSTLSKPRILFGIMIIEQLIAPQLENITWWSKNILRGGANEYLGGKNIQ